jgi:hypothetical protein
MGVRPTRTISYNFLQEENFGYSKEHFTEGGTVVGVSYKSAFRNIGPEWGNDWIVVGTTKYTFARGYYTLDELCQTITDLMSANDSVQVKSGTIVCKILSSTAYIISSELSGMLGIPRTIVDGLQSRTYDMNLGISCIVLVMGRNFISVPLESYGSVVHLVSEIKIPETRPTVHMSVSSAMYNKTIKLEGPFSVDVCVG